MAPYSDLRVPNSMKLNNSLIWPLIPNAQDRESGECLVVCISVPHNPSNTGYGISCINLIIGDLDPEQRITA